jgi:hypothetical protein
MSGVVVEDDEQRNREEEQALRIKTSGVNGSDNIRSKK